jgi:malonyl-CoA O-methyltransferase
MRRGLFVTGTSTNIGKTVLSAAILHRYRALTPLRYWKAVQTGIPEDDDTATVCLLGDASGEEIHRPGYCFPRPLSPHLAARLCGEKVEVEKLVQIVRESRDARSWIVEGAGGVLVPLNQSELMIDLIGALGFPVAVAASSQLGTINHTLLTLEALRSRGIEVSGVVLIGEINIENQRAIETYGDVPVVGAMPRFATLNAATLAAWSKAELDRDRCLEPFLLGRAR